MTACPARRSWCWRRARAPRGAGLHRRRDRARLRRGAGRDPQPARHRPAVHQVPEDCDAELQAETLLRIVEDSMSSEIFELMKRSRRAGGGREGAPPASFVEDCVREMLRGDLRLPGPRPERLRARPPGEPETIHQHNVVAERYGLFGEITAELESGRHSPRHVTMREWLESPRRIALEPRRACSMWRRTPKK